MEFIAGVLVVVLGIFGMAIFQAVFRDDDPARFFQRPLVNIRPLNPRFRVYLDQFPYYARLSEQDRKLFEKRVKLFLGSKRFIPRGLPEVTDEMKTLISASAVQLTFGLPPISLAHFNKILLYPDDYYSTINRTYHKGEVNPRFGIIVLSWRHFLAGYANPDDAVNLGLHEMAHALKIENIIRNEEYDFLNPGVLSRWDEEALLVMARIRNGENQLFRSYAGANQEEFFAVAVEHFFERPEELKQVEPAVYLILSMLLNQDPLKLLNPIR